MASLHGSDSRFAISDSGFTLVELMVVVLIIRILVTIAVPVYTRSRLVAEAKACQTNQRTILSAITVTRAAEVDLAAASAGQLNAGGSGWYGLLVPDRLKSKPTCPVGNGDYYISEAGDLLGDIGPVRTFKPDHEWR